METALSVFTSPPRTVWSEPVRIVRGLVRTADSARPRESQPPLPLRPPSLVGTFAARPHLPRAVWAMGELTSCDWLVPLQTFYFGGRPRVLRTGARRNGVVNGARALFSTNASWIAAKGSREGSLSLL